MPNWYDSGSFTGSFSEGADASFGGILKIDIDNPTLNPPSISYFNGTKNFSCSGTWNGHDIYQNDWFEFSMTWNGYSYNIGTTSILDQSSGLLTTAYRDPSTPNFKIEYLDDPSGSIYSSLVSEYSDKALSYYRSGNSYVNSYVRIFDDQNGLSVNFG